MKCRVPALAGLQLALAGCVYEADLVIAGRAKSAVVDEVAGGYRPSGDVQPPGERMRESDSPLEGRKVKGRGYGGQLLTRC